MADTATKEAPKERDRRQELEAFANTPGNGNHVPAPSLRPDITDRVFGAQAVAVHRDESRILQKLAALGAAAGDDWFYRFPVKNKKENRTDWIEGASIKLANDVARIYGNCEIDTRVIDLGDSWLIYARFTDYESGYSMTRPFQQRKNASQMGGDEARRLDIAFQIGVSKAIRNVVVNSLQTFADYAFDQARNSLIKRIGSDLEAWRDRTIEGLGKIPVETVRAERILGRAAKDWLAPDVAKVIAMMKAIADGMATVEETFPPLDAKPDGEGETNGNGKGLDEFAEGKSEGEADKSETSSSGQGSTTSETGQPAADKADAKGPTSQVDPKASDNAAAGKAQAKPKSVKDYIVYAEAWIEEATDAADVAERWSEEKKIRNDLLMTSEEREPLEKTMKAKVAQLKKK